MSKKIMYPKNSYLDIKAEKSGSGKVNLSSGELFFNSRWLNYVDWQAGLQNLSVSDAVGGSWGINTHCGKGWKLSVSKFLIRREGIDKQDLYTYIDENGSYHEFSEKYYYLQCGEKHYVSKNEVSLDAKGKLTCKVAKNNNQSGFLPDRPGRDPSKPVEPTICSCRRVSRKFPYLNCL